MKSKVLALLIPALLAAGAAHAAEVYNKDGNKLDLYGKVDGLHYFSDNSAKDGDQSYARLGFKGETQINDQLTGCIDSLEVRKKPGGHWIIRDLMGLDLVGLASL